MRGGRPATRLRGDAGSAVVEFVALGLIMLLPLVHLVVLVARVQAGSFAVDAAARSAAVAYAAAPDPATAGARAEGAVLLALRDQGFTVDPAAVTRVDCDGDPCLRPEGRIAVTVSYAVPVPGVPDVLDAVLPLRVPVSGTSVAVVGRFAERAP